MIVWVSGPYGAGKSSVVAATRQLVPSAREFDPELVGDVLAAAAPDVEDFQDLQRWRAVVVQRLAGIDRQGVPPVIVPMTLLRRSYASEIFDELEHRGVRVWHAVLDVAPDELRRRIYAADPDLPVPQRQARQAWRLEHMRAYDDARPWLHVQADFVLDTTGLTVAEAADGLVRGGPLRMWSMAPNTPIKPTTTTRIGVNRMAGEVQIINGQTGLALDTRHAIRPRARVQMFDRNDPPNRNQVWALDDTGRLRCGGSVSQLALEFVDNELRLAEVADDSDTQQWDYIDSRFVNHSAPDAALQIVLPSGREGRLQLAPISDSTAQRWTIIPIADPLTIVEPGPWDGDVDD